MRKLYTALTILLLATLTANAQSPLPPQAQIFLGQVTDSTSNTPLSGATVEFPPFGSTLTNEKGYFEFRHIRPGAYTLRITNIGYTAHETPITLPAAGPIHISLPRVNLFMQPVEVRALRAGEKAPLPRPISPKRK